MSPNEDIRGIYSSESLEIILKKIKEAEVCLSDLDDTDAHSPARMVATQLFHYGNNSRYWRWLASSLQLRLRQGKSHESESWKTFVKEFLSTSEERERLKELFTPSLVSRTLFTGVAEFYQNLTAQKIYLTRNVLEIAQAYADFLGVDKVYAERFDKSGAMEDIFSSHPQRRWVVKGDSPEDEEVIRFLSFQKSRKKIDYVVGIYVSDSPRNQNSCFTLNIPCDYRGLVERLKE